MAKDKKQRREAKRKAKKLAARKRDSISPVKRLAYVPGEIECWMSDNFDEMGQAQIYVFKQATGLSGLAAFLVDRGVVGLKDAWVDMGVDRARFKEALELSRSQGIAMRRVDVDSARHWIAGALRWAFDNGMRLPKDWQRTASFIGGVGDWHFADVSRFAREFAGHPEDLRQRLVSEPFDEYIRRMDIAFVFSTDAPYMDQKTGEYSDWPELDEEEMEEIADQLPAEEMNEIAARMVPAATALAGETAGWLAQRNEMPSAELIEAWGSLMTAQLVAKEAMPDAEEKERADFAYELLEDLSARVEKDRFPEFHRAVGQVLQHLATDTMLMQNAVLEHGLLNAPNAPSEDAGDSPQSAE